MPSPFPASGIHTLKLQNTPVISLLSQCEMFHKEGSYSSDVVYSSCEDMHACILSFVKSLEVDIIIREKHGVT